MSAATDAMAEFFAAIDDSGLVLEGSFRADGTITRHHVRGDKPGTTNGWARLVVTEAGAFGSFGSWRHGISHQWHSDMTRMSPEQRAELREAMARAEREAQAEREASQRWIARGARRDWCHARPANPRHPYLMRKRIQPHGLRQMPSRKDRHDILLVLPLYDVDGVLWSLQFIDADGNKRFLSGGRKRGLFYPMGRIVDRVQIAEGFATAASLYEADDTPTVAAFDCGNLLPVALAIREKHPGAAITLCADNDVKTPNNPGLTKAIAAARAVNGTVIVPPDGYNDFNDVWAARG